MRRFTSESELAPNSALDTKMPCGHFSPPMTEPDQNMRSLRERKKADARRRILASAKMVFFRDGFVNANLDQVAEGAEVAKGTLYRYFESKAELYVAVLAQDGNRFIDKMRASVPQELSPTEQLRKISQWYLQHYLDHSQYFRIFWAIENEPLIGELREPVERGVRELWERSLDIVSDIVKQGITCGELEDRDPWTVANLLWNMVNGIIETEQTPVRRQIRRASIEETFSTALDIFLRGLQQNK